MPSLDDLKKRIKSVKSTQKITKTLQSKNAKYYIELDQIH